MRRTVARAFLLALVLAAGGAARGEEPPKPEAEAAALVAAHAAGSVEEVTRLAKARAASPWLVVDALRASGRPEVADAYVAAVGGDDADALRKQWERERGVPDPAAARAAFAKARETGTSKGAAAALPLLDAIPLDGPSIFAARVLRERAAARAATGDLAGAAKAHAATAKTSEEIGLVRWASVSWFAAAEASYAAGLDADAIAYGIETVRVRRAHSGPRPLGVALGNLGVYLTHVGRPLEALPYAEEALRIFEGLRDVEYLPNAHLGVGRVREVLGRHDEARASYESGLEASRAAKDASGESLALENLAQLHVDRGEETEAVALLTKVMAMRESIGEPGAVLNVALQLSASQARLGDLDASLAGLDRLAARVASARDPYAKARFEARRAATLVALGRHVDAASAANLALGHVEAAGERSGVGETLTSLARVRASLGDAPGALALFDRALDLQRRTDDRAGESSALDALTTFHLGRGDLARARDAAEQRLAADRRRTSNDALADALLDLATVLEATGDHERGLDVAREAETIAQAAGLRPLLARARGTVGGLLWRRGRLEEAEAAMREALALFQAIGQPAQEAPAWMNLGLIQTDRKKLEEAERSHERAVAIWERLHHEDEATRARGNLGHVRLARGDHAGAREAYERALAESRAQGLLESEFHMATGVATTARGLGDLRRALSAVREADDALERLTRSLPEESAARLRAHASPLYSLGLATAVELDDPAALFDVLEAGRAGALLDVLAGRDEVRRALVPDDLRGEQDEALARLQRAELARRRVLSEGSRAEARAARAEEEASAKRVAEVGERVEGRLRLRSEWIRPTRGRLADARALLAPGDALVVYGRSPDRAVALVVTAKDARIVRIGDPKDLDGALAGLPFDKPGADAAATVARLRARLAEPLELGVDVRRVLVSPEATLSGVPFAALLDGRDVALLPSVATWRILRVAPTGSEEILAFGGPTYDVAMTPPTTGDGTRGPALVHLPAAEAEAKAVGDVVRTGDDATEAALRTLLAREAPWRAVHVACHGFADPKRPSLSWLALRAGDGQDGFLRAGEVFGLELRTDLAVLSACETGRGKAYAAEGVVGLSRAFLVAGAPSVLVSLWPVDDEATAELMRRFYAAWNPRDGASRASAARALRLAQEAVRADARWGHPHYWAGWVLWGAGD